MVAAAFFLGSTFTQAIDFGRSVATFVAAMGSVAFAVGFFVLLVRFLAALNSFFKF